MQNKGDAPTSDANVVPITTDAIDLAMIASRAFSQSCDEQIRLLGPSAFPQRLAAGESPQIEQRPAVAAPNVLAFRRRDDAQQEAPTA